ncbi:4-hydroxy-3-methylbut-2-enyl diphosphate reductase [Dissostichus eleginoides]|uniref:4-hydroxy-3-methylbut-2-enyl diphosphate reductase n=1 Tax=Dissostichus eleginoides TaxID=100907 RepID=A0AAD9C4F6_DISEL|nr:4-hydroxy-3-methylbut-2-enyl diphosphate reductase [Dissostichus eleginoides]KAK1895660.1 4-hydroxy-3-methylbut-2-enyl diphosphate reductase [Dissostichus eleginoides]
MFVRLDIFHWIHRFDAAIRTDSHSKYAVFKSALAGAVLAYNRTDLELLIKAVRAKDLDTFSSVSEEDVVCLYITRDQLQHHVRRVTLGAQETFRLIHLAIEELKGPAGLDQSGVTLFKTPGDIDEMWVGQQRHLECIQDPPGMNMYRVARITTINNVDLPYYKSLRGSNSLEGFHKSPMCSTAISGLPD